MSEFLIPAIDHWYMIYKPLWLMSSPIRKWWLFSVIGSFCYWLLLQVIYLCMLFLNDFWQKMFCLCYIHCSKFLSDGKVFRSRVELITHVNDLNLIWEWDESWNWMWDGRSANWFSIVVLYFHVQQFMISSEPLVEPIKKIVNLQ